MATPSLLVLQRSPGRCAQEARIQSCWDVQSTCLLQFVAIDYQGINSKACPSQVIKRSSIKKQEKRSRLKVLPTSSARKLWGLSYSARCYQHVMRGNGALPGASGGGQAGA